MNHGTLHLIILSINKLKQLQSYYYCSQTMNEYPRLFRPCLSAEKVLLTPRAIPIRKYSTRRGLTVNKLNLSSDSTASRPVNSYSFIGRENITETNRVVGQKVKQQLRHSHHARPKQNFQENQQPRLKRVQSIKISPEITYDPILFICSQMRAKDKINGHRNTRYQEKDELEEMLVIRPAPCTGRRLQTEQSPQERPKRQSLCGKTKSSFLQFFKSRKRLIKVSRSPQKLECILQRFLQIRRSKLQAESSC